MVIRLFRITLHQGSSNRYPVYGIELNRKTMEPEGTRREMYFLESWRYGWQRFGEYYDDTFLDAFMEGAWMTKYDGKYYLQYGAPGTEFSGYADQDAEFLGKSAGVYHQYRILESEDGRKWIVLVDKSKNVSDVPHDYIELPAPIQNGTGWMTHMHTIYI